jgi:hypothetical protein
MPKPLGGFAPSLRHKALRQLLPCVRRLPWSLQSRLGVSPDRPPARLRPRHSSVDEFLERNRVDVRGAVLVRGSSSSDVLTGAGTVDVVDVDPFNPDATVVADLGEEGSLPARSYDCCILSGVPPQRLEVALRNMWATLRPGGVLLVALEPWQGAPLALDELIADRAPTTPDQVAPPRTAWCARAVKRGA